jgi:hypothetical protein
MDDNLAAIRDFLVGGIIAAILVGLLVLLTGCGIDTPTEPQEPREPVPSAFTFGIADWADGEHPDTIVIYVIVENTTAIADTAFTRGG